MLKKIAKYQNGGASESTEITSYATKLIFQCIGLVVSIYIYNNGKTNIRNGTHFSNFHTLTNRMICGPKPIS